MTAAGFNPLHEYRAFVERDGYYTLFARKQAEYLLQYGQFSPQSFSDPMRNPNFRYLAHIIDVAVKHDCDLVLFFYPYHSRYLDMLNQLGLWPGFKMWKRSVLDIVDKHAGRFRDLVHVFDFSGYNAVTMERIPVQGDIQTEMRYYWEPGHFKSALGDLMIARIVGKDMSFGYVVTNETIDSVLSAIDAGRTRSFGLR